MYYMIKLSIVKSFNLINSLIMKCFFYNNEDPYYILPRETVICNPKWPTLKIIILHIILNKVLRNAFGKYPLMY